MSRLSTYFGSQGFWLDKRTVWISETWLEGGSHTRCYLVDWQ